MSISTYLSGVRGEFHNIRWPSRRHALLYTLIVIIMSLAIAAYLGVLDAIFSRAVGYLIENF